MSSATRTSSPSSAAKGRPSVSLATTNPSFSPNSSVSPRSSWRRDPHHYHRQSPCYPPPWQQLPHPPRDFWALHSVDQPPWHTVWQEPRLAVIGSRQSSLYGEVVARQFVTELVQTLNVVIISGCAPGIDSIAHQAALQAGGQTIGILGCGLEEVTPRQRRLFSRQNAQLLTEFAPHTPAYKSNFRQRNRLISASADALLVIEANQRSGTQITVNFALEQGKDVFVIPQSLWNQNCAGVCYLVNQGAQLVQSPQELMQEVWGLGAGGSNAKTNPSYRQQMLRLAANGAQKQVLTKLLDNQGRVLASEFVVPAQQAALQALAQKGIISNTFGVWTLRV